MDEFEDLRLTRILQTPLLKFVSQRRNELFLHAFILFVCIADVVTSFQTEYGLGSITLGQLSKPLIFLALFFYCLKMKSHKVEILIITFLFLYILGVEIINGYFHQRTPFFTIGVSGAFKTTLPFYAYFCLKDLYSRGYFSLKTLERAFLLYCFTITFNVIVPVLLGVSFSNYREGGYSGFYQAGNELNAFLVVSLPMLFYFFLEKRTKFILGLTLTMALCALLTGSKSTLGSVLLSFAFVPFLIHWTRVITVPFMAITSGVSAVLIWEYLDKIVALFPSGGIYARLVYTVKQNTSILDILLGVRVKLFDYYVIEFNDSHWLHQLFGKGYQHAHAFMYPIMGQSKPAEMDIIDFIARYGLLGWTLMFLILVWVLLKHMQFKLNYTYALIFSFSLLSMNAILAGHVMSNSFLVFQLAIIFTINHVRMKNNQQNGNE